MTADKKREPRELAKADPTDFWSQFDQLFQDFHDSFYSTIRTPVPAAGSLVPRGGPAPALADVTDLGSAYEITAELPGIPKEKVEVRVIGNSVAISADSRAEREEHGRNYLRRERIWSGFHREIELPEPVEADQVKARFENGLLTVEVPKAHPVVEKRIQVQ